jgi:hypothetical protein
LKLIERTIGKNQWGQTRLILINYQKLVYLTLFNAVDIGQKESLESDPIDFPIDFLPLVHLPEVAYHLAGMQEGRGLS